MDFQYRTFWIEACRLFFERQVVSRVSLERRGIRAFDDVVTDYRSPIYDAHNRLVEHDHFQNKFHVDYERDIRAADLIEPRFIGGTSRSLLDHLGKATDGGAIPARLTLVTPWGLDKSDPIARLVSPRTRELVLHHLFDPRADVDMRTVREQWRARLGGVGDDVMIDMLKHLRIEHSRSLADLDDKLGSHLARAYLAPVDPTSLRHPYADLAKAFITGQTHDHDRDALEALLRREGLWVGPGDPITDRPEQLGIKSFQPFAYQLEDEAKVLNLVPFFHGRDTLAEIDWNRDLLPMIQTFLVEQMKSGGRYDLHLDTHLSIALAAGYALDKSDAIVTPIQRTRTGARIPWAASGGPVTGPLWADPEAIEIGGGTEIAIALEVTQRTRDDVVIYVKEALPNVGQVIAVSVIGGPSRSSVRDGDHAHGLAASLGPLIRDLRPADQRNLPLHLFAAAPVGLMFLVGREATPWGPTTSYEFAFEAGVPGRYASAFTLPPTRPETVT